MVQSGGEILLLVVSQHKKAKSRLAWIQCPPKRNLQMAQAPRNTFKFSFRQGRLNR